MLSSEDISPSGLTIQKVIQWGVQLTILLTQPSTTGPKEGSGLKQSSALWCSTTYHPIQMGPSCRSRWYSRSQWSGGFPEYWEVICTVSNNMDDLAVD